MLYEQQLEIGVYPGFAAYPCKNSSAAFLNRNHAASAGLLPCFSTCGFQKKNNGSVFNRFIADGGSSARAQEL